MDMWKLPELKDKMEIVVFGQTNPLHAQDSVIGPLSSYCHPSVRNLGVIVDSLFKLNRSVLSQSPVFII